MAHKDLVGHEETSLHSHPGINVSGATAYNGTSPTIWTDLDLSSIVGVKSALVLLAISAEYSLNGVAIRKKGDIAEYYQPFQERYACGVAAGRHNSVYANVHLVLICVTDINGIIQWITESSQTAIVKVIVYLL